MTWSSLSGRPHLVVNSLASYRVVVGFAPPLSQGRTLGRAKGRRKPIRRGMFYFYFYFYSFSGGGGGGVKATMCGFVWLELDFGREEG